MTLRCLFLEVETEQILMIRTFLTLKVGFGISSKRVTEDLTEEEDTTSVSLGLLCICLEALMALILTISLPST